MQGLRYTGEINTVDKKVQHILNATIRLSIILILKSSDQKSNVRSVYIPGTVNKGQQGPDVDVVMASYKKEMPIKLKKKSLVDIPWLLVHM